MTENENTNSESPGFSRKVLRIIIIVAIGIPVLLELNTLFNLVKVNLGEEETKSQQVVKKQKEGYVVGDTLYAGSSSVVVIREMQINVSPTQWNFTLTLGSEDEKKPAYNVLIDSVTLRKGRSLKNIASLEWKKGREEEIWKSGGSWEVPNGGIPTVLYISLKPEERGGDTLKEAGKKFELGSIPIRYHR